MVEEISIAVTLEKSALPANTTLEELKELIAHAASPKADPANVSIAFSDATDPYLASDRPVNLPKPDETGNPWWLAVAVSGIGLIIVFRIISNKVKAIQEENAQEVEMLRQRTQQQEQQLSDINQRANQLTQRQSELAQNLIEQQQRDALPGNADKLAETLSDLSSQMSDQDDEETAEKIKSWIEQG